MLSGTGTRAAPTVSPTSRHASRRPPSTGSWRFSLPFVRPGGFVGVALWWGASILPSITPIGEAVGCLRGGARVTDIPAASSDGRFEVEEDATHVLKVGSSRHGRLHEGSDMGREAVHEV